MKTTGAEFNRFYSDPEYWPEGRWHDDTDVTVNGVHEEDLGSLQDLPADALVQFTCGDVYEDGGYDKHVASFPAHFKRWKKAQTTESAVVEFPKGKADEVAAAIAALGGKVVR